MPYPKVKAREVQEIIGDTMDEDIETETLVNEAKEKFHVFMFRPTYACWGPNTQVQERWEKLLSKEHVVPLEDPEAISVMIALFTLIYHTLRAALANPADALRYE